jgi:hypothetical protein
MTRRFCDECGDPYNERENKILSLNSKNVTWEFKVTATKISDLSVNASPDLCNRCRNGLMELAIAEYREQGETIRAYNTGALGGHQ